MPRPPVFLQKRNYRHRRMMDAVRMLAVLGLALWLLPLLWPEPNAPLDMGKEAIPTSVALRYLFGVWAGLIAAAFALWIYTRDGDNTDQAGQD